MSLIWGDTGLRNQRKDTTFLNMVPRSAFHSESTMLCTSGYVGHRSLMWGHDMVPRSAFLSESIMFCTSPNIAPNTSVPTYLVAYQNKVRSRI
eukprot:218226-Rhodomonas_salina.1